MVKSESKQLFLVHKNGGIAEGHKTKAKRKVSKKYKKSFTKNMCKLKIETKNVLIQK